ncbi:hypothetical protein BDN71DRAFT_1514745 [Pleurotus eryngii]|uniref:Uncharacterized protein n=1 Tax=Pleurotus eryngii TaxID=5323 RepID=A0A9P5ZIV2_PLEER|nr:hypothetical protein BDN71DRAFT_1514745 [Pleurotus eryngii]
MTGEGYHLTAFMDPQTPPTTPPTTTIPIEDTPITPPREALRPRSESDASTTSLYSTCFLSCTRPAFMGLSANPPLSNELRNIYEINVTPILATTFENLSTVQRAGPSAWTIDDSVASYALITQNFLSISQAAHILSGLSDLAATEADMPSEMTSDSVVTRFLQIWEHRRSAYVNSPGPWFWWRTHSSTGFAPAEADHELYNDSASDGVLLRLAVLHHEMLTAVQRLPDAQEVIQEVEAWFFLILTHLKEYGQ